MSKAIDSITASGVRDAANRLKTIIVETPLLENADLNERVGGRVLLKAEVLQHFGSFKLRGAYNRLAQLTENERAKGVVAWSSGNHAQGVAYAAKLLNCHSTIIMPKDAPSIKLENVKALGAEIVLYDRAREHREEIGIKIAQERGAAIAPSFDHPQIIEGQGTLALEVFQEASRRGVSLDGFIACCGGGGLAAGASIILNEISPATKIYLAEPEFYDEGWISVRDGKRAYADITKPTLCDAIATPTLGEFTLPILSKSVSGGFAVTDREVAEAMAFAFKSLKVLVEPGGAVALAAILSGKFDVSKKNVAATLSGGNVDLHNFISIMKRHSIAI